MFFRVVAHAAVVAHFAFLAFGLFGGLAAWRWPRLIWWQAAAATWLVLVVAVHLPCPLTWLEDTARRHAGMPALPGGFLANHVAGVFYPHGHEVAARAVAALVVLGSWVGLVVVRRRRPSADGTAEIQDRRKAIGHGAPPGRR